jgi:antitoxin component of RelBE/YafQ-DinJ toxin-antitoxin module
MKTRMTITIDPELLKETKAILKGTGVTLSGFICLTLQGLVDSRQKPMAQMYEDMALSMLKKATAHGAKGKRLT